jgi:hypothetical protein
MTVIVHSRRKNKSIVPSSFSFLIQREFDYRQELCKLINKLAKKFIDSQMIVHHFAWLAELLG